MTFQDDEDDQRGDELYLVAFLLFLPAVIMLTPFIAMINWLRGHK